MQNSPPGKDKETNWLPTSKDEDFSPHVRAYWLKTAVTDGSLDTARGAEGELMGTENAIQQRE